MNSVLLDLLALGAILSGIMVITAKNPVISVLFLIAVFVNVACYLVLLGAAYLGLVYLIVYVGAIAILFLFVIMMLNLRLVELVDTGQEYTQNLPMGAFLGSLFFFELLSILPVNYHDGGSLHAPLSIFNWFNTTLLGASNSATVSTEANVHAAFNPVVSDSTMTAFTQIESIGQGLYTYASLWLVIASVIFLLAMVGPIVLCMAPAPAPSTATGDAHKVAVSNDTSSFSINPLLYLLFGLFLLLAFFTYDSGETALLVSPLLIPKHMAYYRNLDVKQNINALRFRFKNKSIVYGILCRSTQKIYVGSTMASLTRMWRHLDVGDQSNVPLQNDIKQHGIDNITVLIFEVVSFQPGMSYEYKKSALRDVEQSYIDKFPVDRLYNVIKAKAN